MAPQIRIGLVLSGGDSWRGGVEYFTNLVKAVEPFRTAGQVALALFTHEVDQQAFAESIAGFGDLVVPFTPPRRSGSSWGRRWGRLLGRSTAGRPSLQRAAADAGIDFLYPYHHPYGPVVAERPQVPTAAWIPDFQHRRMPDFFDSQERRDRDRAHELAAARADCLVLSSAAALADFHHFHPAATLPTEVLHFHTSTPASWFTGDPSAALARHGVPERFFLCSNQFWIHKNHATLVEALGLLKQRGIAVTLVCTGLLEDYRHPGHVEALKRRARDLALDDRLFLLGLVPRAEQIQLLRQAVAVIQPSLFEGWSTVVEDGRALGKRLLLSDIPVHREQSPPGCMFFEPRSVAMLADLMAEAWNGWPSGPQPAAEAAARETSRQAISRFGTEFVRIAMTIAGRVRRSPP